MQQPRSNSSMAFGCLIPLFPVLSCLPLAFSILRRPKKTPKTNLILYLRIHVRLFGDIATLSPAPSDCELLMPQDRDSPFFFNNLLLQVYACWSCAQGLPKKKKVRRSMSKALCFTCTGCTGYWALTSNTTTAVLHFLFSLATMWSFQALSGDRLLLGRKEINKVITLATFLSPHRLCSHGNNKWLAPQSGASGHRVLLCAKHVCERTYCCNMW